MNLSDLISNNWYTPPGLILISLFLYLFAYFTALYLTPVLNNFINFEDRLKRQMRYKREKFKERFK